MPAKAAPLSYLKGTAVCSAADTYTQQSITTGLSTDETTAYRVLNIDCTWRGIVEIDSSATFALTRKGLAAIPQASDNSVMFYDKWGVLLTTSGIFEHNYVRRYCNGIHFNELLIVSDPIYSQIVTGGFGAAQTMDWVITFEKVKISSDERNSLLVAALT